MHWPSSATTPFTRLICPRGTPPRTARWLQPLTATTGSWSQRTGGFRDSHLLKEKPRRLLHVSTGNITNQALLELVRRHFKEIERAFERGSYVELTVDSLIIHSYQPE